MTCEDMIPLSAVIAGTIAYFVAIYFWLVDSEYMKAIFFIVLSIWFRVMLLPLT
jgi:hypothetical protein